MELFRRTTFSLTSYRDTPLIDFLYNNDLPLQGMPQPTFPTNFRLLRVDTKPLTEIPQKPHPGFSAENCIKGLIWKVHTFWSLGS